MRRSPIYFSAIVVALVTAVALLRLGELLTLEPISSQVTHGSRDSALVRSFYDAVNATLDRGQPADLDQLMAVDFVAHGAQSGQPVTRDGFGRHLLAVHAMYPTLRLSVHDMLVRDDVVVAHVRVEGVTAGAFLNLPLAGQSAPWGAVDVFRIASGRIAEHWGGQEQTLLLESLQQVVLDVPSSDLRSVTLSRITRVTGGSMVYRAIAGPEAIYLESGQLAVDVAPGGAAWRPPPGGAGDPAMVQAGSATTLTPGELILLPKGTRVTIRSSDGAPITFLVIALRTPDGSTTSGWAEAAMAAASPGYLTTIDLAEFPLVALPSGPAVLGLGRATIAPGATFAVASPGVARVAVESGRVSLASSAGTVWSRHGADGWVTTARDRILGAGDAIVFQPGASGELRNADDTPLVLLVVTITPVPDGWRRPAPEG